MRMPLHLPLEDKTHVKCRMMHEYQRHIGFAFVLCACWAENPKTPPPCKLSLMADEAIGWCISVGYTDCRISAIKS